MRNTLWNYLTWIVFGVLVAGSYGAAKLFAWDPGALDSERDRVAGGPTRGGAPSYWSTGFGGK